MDGAVNRSRGSSTAFVRFSSLKPDAVVRITVVTTLLECSVLGKTDWIDDVVKDVFMRPVVNLGKVEMVVTFIRCGT